MENSKPSPLQLREYLKDAGSYDSTMNTNEMYQLYKTLELSKHTATQDDEHRSILEDTEKNCSMVEELRKNSFLVDDCMPSSSQSTPDIFDALEDEFETALNEAELNREARGDSTLKYMRRSTPPSLLDVTTDIPSSPDTNNSRDLNDIDTYNSVPNIHKSLTKIEIQPIYSFPFYCRPEILALSYNERELLIGEYHCRLLNNLEHLQRKSLYSAPWGKPIQSNTNFNGSLNKKVENLPECVINEEESDSESDFQMFTSRAGRQTKRKMYTEDLIYDDTNRNVASTELIVTNEPPTKKRLNLSTIKNDEISRSKSTRVEQMFDKLLEDEPKKLEAEKIIEDFKDSLNCSSDEEFSLHMNSDIADIIHSEEPFQRRRIEPPSGRPGAKNKSRGRGGRRTPNKKPSNCLQIESTTYAPLETTVNNIKIKKGICPLCGEHFFQEELETHAATCGETNETVSSTINTRQRATKSQSITCEACDSVFLLNTDYEVHVRECLAKRKN